MNLAQWKALVARWHANEKYPNWRVDRLGYIPDHHSQRTQKLSALSTAGLPKSVSLERFESPILDQGPYGSCGGHGTSQALTVAYAAAGIALPFIPSPDGIYKITRCVQRSSASEALIDSGVVPSAIMVGLAAYGIRAMGDPVEGRFSDCGGSDLNTEPELLELEESGMKIDTGTSRIDEGAPDAVAQGQASLAVETPLGIGVAVDQAFEDWDPSKGPLDKLDTNNILGGHWLCWDTYDTSSSGIVTIRGPNSWGSSWGDNGHFEVTANWLRQAASDIYRIGVSS